MAVNREHVPRHRLNYTPPPEVRPRFKALIVLEIAGAVALVTYGLLLCLGVA